MISFSHERLHQRVQMGTGNAAMALAAEILERGSPRVLLIGTDRAASFLASGLVPVAHVTRVQRHVPIESVTNARALAIETKADVVVSIGGGSATGLAKAIALENHLPIIAVPTTYAGSEATAMWGITENRRKSTGTAPHVLPQSVIYDTKLFVGLPRELTVASSINALAHGIDAMWAPRADPLSATDAEAGIRWIASALRALVDEPDTYVIRELIVGTYLSSTAFASAGSGMHHKICHVLGGTFDLPHAPLHTAVLPHVLAFNASADVRSAEAIGRALNTREPVAALVDIYDHVNAPRSLGGLGFKENDIDLAAELCLEAIPSSNPRPVTLSSLRGLLHDAWVGASPAVRRTK